MNVNEYPLPPTPFMLIPAIVLWLIWYLHIFIVTTLASRHLDRMVLYITPPACLLLLFVTGYGMVSSPEIFLLELTHFFSEALLLAVAIWLFSWFGISARDDVAERCNHFAGWVIAGALLGLTLEVARIAPGTTMSVRWTDDFSMKCSNSLLGTIAFLGFWAIFEKLTALSEAVTVDRDGGAALRLAAFLIALGILLGQALLELSSYQRLLEQPLSWSRVLRMVGPLVLFIVGVAVERTRRPRHPGRPNWADGLIAASYLGGSCLLTYVTA